MPDSTDWRLTSAAADREERRPHPEQPARLLMKLFAAVLTHHVHSLLATVAVDPEDNFNRAQLGAMFKAMLFGITYILLHFDQQSTSRWI